MLCLGSIYAWSIFVPELKNTYQITTAQTQLIFGTVIAVFTLTMIWTRYITNHFGPKLVASISGILFFVGYLVAFISKGNFFILWFGIGILGGMGYIVSLSVPVKWYPNKRGGVTGIIVAGFGAGAILLTYLAEYLIKQNVCVLEIFLYIGVMYGAIILLAAQKFNMPHAIDAPKKTMQLNKKHGVYLYQLILGIFAGTFTGLLVIGNLKPIAQLQNVNELIIPLSISLFALANFTGRITWGWLSDKFNNVYLVPLALLLQGCASVMLFFLSTSDMLFMSLVILIGFSFGANFVLFARETIYKFGIESYDKIYPFIFLGYGVAGIVGPFIGGRVFDITGSYHQAVILAFVLSLMASVIFIFIQKGLGMGKLKHEKTKLFTQNNTRFRFDGQ